MGNLRTLQILEQVLGKSKHNSHTGEVGFHCPFCKHHKRKFNIHIETEKWQCWVCSAKGRTIASLFRKLKVSQDIMSRLAKIIGKTISSSTTKTYDDLSLPLEYIPLYLANKKSPEYKNAMHYLIGRGISGRDILRHSIGYCESGRYGGMIIIPSYDCDGNLNFFTGRSYYEDANYKHNNPRVSKDIIGFDLFVNWNEPITIVEGAFDALAVRNNSIPLFGKLMLDNLKAKILKNKVSRINIALDSDAIGHSLKIAEYFMSLDKEVHIVELGDQDPSEMGHDKFQDLLNDSKPLTFEKIMEYKFICK
tara:strand:- start:1150 stop:2070 length:921 start_codon:yes stop_codon:yes gene_type:complete